MRSNRISVLVSMLALATPTLAAAQQDAAATAGARPLYSDEDLLFLRHMSIHHEQALDMCALVAARTQRDEFVRFARYVERAQAAEIGLMRSLLELAAERGLRVPEHGPHGDPPMAGMLSAAEMDALEAASGAEFEQLWLGGMIFHHEGALAMARAQQLHQLARGRRPYTLGVLVEDILVEQRAEITKMSAWLDAWGLSTRAAGRDTRLPAAGITSPAPGATLPLGAAAVFIGTALDDTDIASVGVAVRNPSTGEWWRSDRTWGERHFHAADLERSGSSSAAWRLAWTPPAAGRYELHVQPEDTTGKRAAAPSVRAFAVQ